MHILPGLQLKKAVRNQSHLTFDIGHMEVAPLIAAVLKRQSAHVTFLAANERTKVGDGTLGAALGFMVEGACCARA